MTNSTPVDAGQTHPSDPDATPSAAPAPRVPQLDMIPGGLVDLDAKAHVTLESDPDGELAIRVSLQVYEKATRTYTSWDRVAWKVTLYAPEQATQFREALGEFMQLWVANQAAPVTK